MGDPQTASHAPTDNKEERGTEKGKQNVDRNLERVVSTLESRVAEFGKSSQDIKVLAEAVQALTDDVRSLKRKQSDTNSGTDTSKGGNSKSDVPGLPQANKQSRTMRTQKISRG